MDDAIRKAEVLVEALGYIRNFRDRITVVKLGGSAMEDPAALTATLQSVVFLETVGLRPVLVHGGGKPIDRAMAGVIPVIPSLAYDAEGGWLNVNADTAACAVAAQLQCAKLVMLTDTPGILSNPKDPGTLVSHLDTKACRQLVECGAIDGGMLPKVEACFDALKAGVGKVHVIDGRRKYSLLLEIFTESGVGTEIVL